MPKYYYQTIQVSKQVSLPQGQSMKGKAVGSAIELLHKAAVALNGWAISYRVNKEIGKLSHKIDKLIPAAKGVLICVGIKEWEMPDATGAKAQSFLSIHIAGWGNDPKKLVHDYLIHPRLVQGASEGWVRKDVFLWVTKT
jgi:hypothetical protein